MADVSGVLTAMQTPKVVSETNVGEVQKRNATTAHTYKYPFKQLFFISLRLMIFFKKVVSHECSFKTRILFSVSVVAFILESLASMILERSSCCKLANGLLLTITAVVTKKAATEGAPPRFLNKIPKARETCTGSNQIP